VPNWFAEEPYTASAYAGAEGTMYPVYLSIKNPLTITNFDMNDDAKSAYALARRLGVDIPSLYLPEDAKAYNVVSSSQFVEAAQAAGYDGIKVKEGDYNTYAAFEPTQIKSATGNIGTYSPTRGNISEERQGKPTPTEAGREALATLDATGMQLQPPDPSRIEKIKGILKAAGEDPALTKESAKSAVKKFLDKMEVAAFSGDAAFNNDIRRNLQKDFADNPEVLGMLLEASQSQAVHADA
jgi:hypothetical protein